jgi:hypothetical protein
MPPRCDVDPDYPDLIPEPTLTNYPFGETVKYHDSMILHYVDELDMTYKEASQTWNRRSLEYTLRSDALRQRYERSLEHLVQVYGVKSAKEMNEIVVTTGMRRRKGRRSEKYGAMAQEKMDAVEDEDDVVEEPPTKQLRVSSKER